MSKVTRYSEGDAYDPRPFPHPDGEWVEYDEYQQIEAKLAKARALLSGWRETWNDGLIPDGDLLDDTDKALTGQEGESYD
jgi:hypothetical protein